MQVISSNPRPDFEKKVDSLGLKWQKFYWLEDKYYKFTPDQINTIAKATEELHQMFLEAGEFVVNSDKLTSHFDIPREFVPEVIRSWNEEPDCLNYGRFDLGYDGVNPPKLFEYNCDTPTSLLEASVIQWDWKNDLFPESDQFNNIHEKFVEAYAKFVGKKIHFCGIRDTLGEDLTTIGYHMDLAQQAGANVEFIDAFDIGVRNSNSQFVDMKEQDISILFHLYPWEWMLNEKFGKHILKSKTTYIEPIWKSIWSNKAILPVLSYLFPDSPYLLNASFDQPVGEVDYVKKPTLSREGANITIFRKGKSEESTGGTYGEGRHIYQELYELPNFNGHYPVIGSWCVNGESVGIGIREDNLITANSARFIPHIIGE